VHVSPVPTRTTGRRAGGRSAIAIVVPIAGLVLTVAFGLAGRVLDGGRGPTAGGADAAARTPAPGTARPDRPTPTPPLTAALQEVPTTAYRLPVRGVPDLLADAKAGAALGQLVAVSGSFTLDPRVADCPLGRSLADDFCERRGLLASSPRPVLAVDDNGIEPEAVRLTVGFPSLAVRVPVGVALPTVVIWASAVPGAVEPVPVIAIGRLEEGADDCAPAAVACAPDLILERVAWFAGEWGEGHVVRSATVDVEAVARGDRATQVIAMREVDRGEPILGRALLSIDDLRLVDAEAAGAIRVAVEGPVWYVRSVGRPTEPGGPRGVVWAAIDQQTGLVLASGSSASP
jgi:hypothetical protein